MNKEYMLKAIELAKLSLNSEDVPVGAVVVKGGKASEVITDNGVIGGNINENGYFALITREKGYKA